MKWMPLADQIKGKLERRARALDRLCKTLVEIDELTEQIDRDLDRMVEERNAERPGRMA